MIFVSKKPLNKVLCALALIIAIGFVTACRQAEAEEFKFVSAEFQDALHNVTIDYFLAPPKPEPKDLKLFYLEDKYEEYRNPKLAEAEAAYEHYPKLGDKLCEPIAKAYEEMLKVPLKRTEAAYQFDSELLKVMRSSGAYVLPISSGRGKVDGIFTVKDAEKLKQEYFKSFGEAEKLANAPKYEAENKVLFLVPSTDEGEGDYRKYIEFYNAVNRYGIQGTEKFDFDFKFVRSFLFVLGDTASFNGERIYFYVELPYKISGTRVGEIDELQYVPGSDLGDHVKCYTYSKTGLYYSGISSKKKFIDKGMADATVLDLEPLSIPLHSEYARDEIRRDDGQKGFRKNYYTLERSEVSEQSLECWMLAVGFASGDIKKCQNSGYADEYLKMLNSNICAWKDRTVETPKVNYPLTVDAGLHRADYMRLNNLSYNNRCNPETLPENRKD
ncbi:MAG: hypothetical protein HYS17_03090 [Micavibrio aeruginosavorus]|uniref:DUF4852 domain-containing protein n=1 Tax=Micavibrio aeruginosavorus TaxID=349221 RepID=A0A7T5R3I9_9BACT|nr:MAG: hypothetical protein HYS17_03090 [Micavibrio aeruginosavorus]